MSEFVKKIIDIKNLRYEYINDNEKKNIALDGISFSVNKGELISILGHNGSGKSTLAKLLNGQILPTDGDVEIFGINTKDEDKIWDIRQKCAMVFQNPDNQLVATVVEEDVAFGPENLGVDPIEIRKRVDEALDIVEMKDYQKHSPHMLSGGQKQRIAIASVLSMKPEIIIFDESTAMLDPIGRKDIMDTILRLNKKENITILFITHYMEESVLADRVIVLNEGKIEFDDSPKKVFSNIEDLKKLGLSVPQVTELSYLLKSDGVDIPSDILTNEEMIEILEKKLK